jgi:hypothetical protein
VERPVAEVFPGPMGHEQPLALEDQFS